VSIDPASAAMAVRVALSRVSGTPRSALFLSGPGQSAVSTRSRATMRLNDHVIRSTICCQRTRSTRIRSRSSWLADASRISNDGWS
jgi:hypothetical protein